MVAAKDTSRIKTHHCRTAARAASLSKNNHIISPVMAKITPKTIKINHDIF